WWFSPPANHPFILFIPCIKSVLFVRPSPNNHPPIPSSRPSFHQSHLTLP
ncbi:MAG: hypothetical protein AVDCRST_MAG56-6538, partial [uncultured Cytophagales bacterium]